MIILIILLVALPVVLLTALFTNKGIVSSATIDIDRPQLDVFNHLSHPDNQVKFKYGNATLQTVSLSAPGSIELVIIFEKPLKSQATCKFELLPLNDHQTRVKWHYHGNPHPSYLLRVLHLLLKWNKPVIKNVQAVLQNAKQKLEQP